MSAKDPLPKPIEPPVEVAADGTIAVPTGPGLGVAIREDRIENATLKRAQLSSVDAPV